MVSVVIVTWNSEEEIIQCLDSVYSDSENHKISVEVIVVDNNSSDKTLEKIKLKNYSSLSVICNKENFGYTVACNQGMKKAKGEYVFLLNPDTIINNGSILKLVNSFAEFEGCGAVAPKLINSDGSLQDSCRNFPDYSDLFFEMSLLLKNLSKWKIKKFNPENPVAVEQPMAAALMIRKSLLEKIDFMDERYKMFFNDVDLCKKIYLSGYNIMLIPSAEIIHEKGVSIYKDRSNMIKIWNSDCVKYFQKYFGNSYKLSLLKNLLNLSSIFRK
ncbi:MAG TPA: glycosyltransferase family 2 protein [Ignavibacteria bacterium]|nr:glycosyltransferase family 2 protein [Ignavibacteria bacterium]